MVKIDLNKTSTKLSIIVGIIFIVSTIYGLYSYVTRPQPYIQIIAFHESILPNVYNLVIKNVGNESAQFLSFSIGVNPSLTKIVNYSIEGNMDITTPFSGGIGSFMDFQGSNISPGELDRIKIQLNSYSNLTIDVNKIDSKYCISIVQVNFGQLTQATEANKSIKIPPNITAYVPINLANNGNCNISGEIPIELT